MGRVLVVSASMGEGHDGAARELVRRLEARGHTTRMVDFLDAPPLGIGAMWRTSYELQLRKAPWTYQFTYRLWMVLPILCRPLTMLVSFFTARCQLRWIAEFEPDVIVTTYNLSSLVLARLRRKGRVDVPVVTYVTDFDVHPLWLARGVDLALCVHPASAEVAARRTRRPARATGPLVADAFEHAHSRTECRQDMREQLGLAPDDVGVLVVAGSWGVGEIDRTFDSLAASGRYTPVAVCGRNEELRADLAARFGGRAIGWTDEMPSLMVACDVLVQNAGGLTCMEAFAVGLPVVTYLPIPGHGRQNGQRMEEAGVAAYARSAEGLVPALDRVTSLAGRRQVTAARAMFRSDPADDVVTALEPAATRVASSRRAVGGRRLVAAAVSLVAGWSALTVGVSAAAAQGIGVARPQRHSHEVFVGVRLGDAALSDPGLAKAMAGAGVSAIVDGTLADHDRAGVRRLSDAGVDVANGGWGHRNGAHWARAKADVVRACRSIRSANGQQPCHDFVPLRRVDGFDLASARLAHQRVVANVALLAPDRAPRFRAGRIYVLDARLLDAATVERTIATLRPSSAAQHLSLGPLADLH